MYVGPTALFISTPTTIHALTTYFSVGLAEKQLELCGVQADSVMRGNRDLDSREFQFWRLVLEKYPKLNDCTSTLCASLC